MQILSEQPDQEQLQPIQLSLLRQFYSEYPSRNTTIEEMKLLKQQNDMIEEIRKNIIQDRKRICVTECSESESQLSINSRFDDSENWVKLKPRKRVPLGTCEMNFTERSNRQSKELKKLVHYESEARYYENLYKKEKKSSDEMKQRYCLAERKIAEQEITIKNLNSLVNSYEQKNKLRQITNKSSAEIDVRRMEAALLVRERLVQADIKRLSSLRRQVESERERQRMEREQLDSLWDEMMKGVDDGFRRQVMTKCKQSLMRQRQILSAQEAELDKKHEQMERMMKQLQH